MPISAYLKTNLEVINHVDLEQQSVILNHDSRLLSVTKKVSRLCNFVRWLLSKITCNHFLQNPQLDEATRLIIDEIGREIQARAGITSEEKTALSDSLKKLQIIGKKNGGGTSKLEAMLGKVEALIPVQILVPKIPINENQDVPKLEDPVKTKDPIREPKEDQKNENVNPDANLKKPVEENQKDVINHVQDNDKDRVDPNPENPPIINKNPNPRPSLYIIEEDLNETNHQPLDKKEVKVDQFKHVNVTQEKIKDSLNDKEKKSEQLERTELLNKIKNGQLFDKELVKQYKDDKNFFIQASKDIPYAIRFADKTLQEDKEFIKQLLSLNGAVIDYLLKDFKTPENYLIAVKTNPEILGRIDNPTIELILKLIEQNTEVYQYLTEDQQNDEQIALKAIEKTNDIDAIYANLPHSLKYDFDFMLKAVNKKYGIVFSMFMSKNEQQYNMAVKLKQKHHFKQVGLKH